MTQPAWQRKAREFLPELLPKDRSATSLHDFALDLFGAVKAANPPADLFARVFDFINYCLNPARAESVKVDVVEGFVRHALADGRFRREVQERLFANSETVLQYAPDRMPEEAFVVFKELVRNDPRWNRVQAGERSGRAERSSDSN